MPSAVTAARTATPAATPQASPNAVRAATRPTGRPSTATNTRDAEHGADLPAHVDHGAAGGGPRAGRSAVAAERIVGSASPTPAPPTSFAGQQDGGVRGPRVSRKAAIGDADREQQAADRGDPARPDSRRDSRWPTAANTGTITGPTAMPRPVRMAE